MVLVVVDDRLQKLVEIVVGHLLQVTVSRFVVIYTLLVDELPPDEVVVVDELLFGDVVAFLEEPLVHVVHQLAEDVQVAVGRLLVEVVVVPVDGLGVLLELELLLVVFDELLVVLEEVLVVQLVIGHTPLYQHQDLHLVVVVDPAYAFVVLEACEELLGDRHQKAVDEVTNVPVSPGVVLLLLVVIEVVACSVCYLLSSRL